MGCAGSTRNSVDGKAVAKKVDNSMGAAERSFKAALLIQKWYRRYLARQEIKRRCSWTIFQSLEYAGEQDQIKLYNFFLDLITHLSAAKPTFAAAIIASPHQSVKGRPKELEYSEQEDTELRKNTNPEDINVEDSYTGPRLSLPLKTEDVTKLIDHFKEKRLLHARYVLLIMHEARKVLRCRPNINAVSTAFSKQVTVCGDLHGKLEDLVTIFYKNGLPARDNPYVFNGDFVDRGFQSIEVFILLLISVVVWPDSIYLNRGNHEDFSVNIRYGFIKEIMFKYTREATRIIQVIEDVYSWLPLASIIDNKVFVVHGGIADDTDLKKIASLDRHQFLTVLRPPMVQGKLSYNPNEWKQLVDLLWSDPRPVRGCSPNGLRGGGSFFGPDITQAFLAKHGLQRIIRSHECKLDGYEYTHQGKVMTIFSASNYYDIGSNRGAFVRLIGPALEPCPVLYVSSQYHRSATVRQRHGYVEESALRELKKHIYASQTILLEKFEAVDTEKTGKIGVTDWGNTIESVVGVKLPWRLLCPKIARYNTNEGLVEYKSSFEEYALTNNSLAEEGPSLLELLYRNKDNLETIFRIMDKDGSGRISMQEFTDGCDLLGQHIGSSLSPEQVRDLARSIDFNKDGFIDFNEFLEAFRLVDRKCTPNSERKPDTTPEKTEKKERKHHERKKEHKARLTGANQAGSPTQNGVKYQSTDAAVT